MLDVFALVAGEWQPVPATPVLAVPGTDYHPGAVITAAADETPAVHIPHLTVDGYSSRTWDLPVYINGKRMNVEWDTPDQTTAPTELGTA
jgi:hypothetical protein